VADHEVLVLHRFDRQGHTRIPYLSAMTLLGTVDHEGGDYVALAHAVRSHSAHPRQALQELFDRVLHSVLLHNTDDHLRNHGFLRTRAGWVPSPVFDVNPTLEGSHTRATSIAGAQHHEDEPEGVLALAPHCGLDPDQVVERIERACAAFSNLDEVATRRGIDARTTRILTDLVARRSAALTRVTRKIPRSQPMALSHDKGQLRVGPGHPRGGQFARKQEQALASS
jgi:serine/threonine-protein kinase HipA